MEIERNYRHIDEIKQTWACYRHKDSAWIECDSCEKAGVAVKYHLWGLDGKTLLYIGISNNFDRRLVEHAETKIWFWQIGRVTVFRYFDNYELARSHEEESIQTYCPVYNVDKNPVWKDTRLHQSMHAVKCPFGCGWTDPWDDTPDESSLSWVSAHLCPKCGAQWQADWDFFTGEPLNEEED